MTCLFGSSNKLFYPLIAMSVYACGYDELRCMCLAPHTENSFHCTRGSLQIKYFPEIMICASTSGFYKLILKVLPALNYYNATFSYFRINTPKRWVISSDPREISSRMSLGGLGGSVGWAANSQFQLKS